MIIIEVEITIEQMIEEFGYKESYIKGRFKDFQRGVEKKFGVKIRDNGKRGANRKYFIERPIKVEDAIDRELPPDLPIIGDKRFESELAIALSDLGLYDYELMILTYLIWLPMQSFRGSIPMFTTACKQEPTPAALKGISEALDRLKNRGWIELIPLDADRVFYNYSSTPI